MSTIPVQLTPEEEAALIAQAKAEGVSVDSLLRRAVLQIISGKVESKPKASWLSPEKFERAFEEIADMIPDDIPALSEEGLSPRKHLHSRRRVEPSMRWTSLPIRTFCFDGFIAAIRNTA